MRPVLHHAALVAVCASALVLAGCGKHLASNAPITFAPADTPYLFANFKGAPEDVTKAWSEAGDAMMSARIQQFGRFADAISQQDPTVAAVLNAIQAELADVHSSQQLAQATGFSRSALYAIYGVGDVPVARIELASPDNTFKAFWARVEKRAGITTPTTTLDNQTYRVIGSANGKLRFLVAIEGKQLVLTLAPANASPAMLEQLLGLTKPSSNAADKLARIDGQHDYSDYGSGFLDPPKLFANLFDGKDAVTQEFAKDLGGSLTNPACASEFQSLAGQVPLISGGMHTYTASEISGNLDVQLSPALLGALTALKQPVPGIDEQSDGSMFDMVLALPLQKWQAFIKGRAEAAAKQTYQCPALQSLNNFAKTAANPPVQMPPEAASLLGFRVVLDKWDIGPQIAGRVLVASSNPAELAQKIQQTLPQFALKTIPTNGKPVAFNLPPRLQAMLGSGSQGWITANDKALAVGVGDGEDSKLAGALSAPAGNGDTLMRVHFDGKMYQVLGSWIGRVAAMQPAANQAQVQGQVAMFNQMSRMIGAVDLDVKLDDSGLHVESDVKHR
ncbi:MAG: hypothetical protein EPN36_04540 [Rhodanobacteraceae bacterium]|nr:MAG: hypothetical protein EPN36_04540 [Rhodanobacteraceae bacterium]